MKVICIDNVNKQKKISSSEHFSLTIGKWYECINITNHYYMIINDLGFENTISKNYFLTKEEYRNQKLEEIGI